MIKKASLEKIREFDIGRALRDWRRQRWLFVTAVFICLTAIISIDFLPGRVTDLVSGKPSPRTIKATRDVQVVDEQATAERRADAERAVGKIYHRDANSENRAVQQIKRVFSAVEKLMGNQSLTADERYSAAVQEVGGTLGRATFDQLAGLSGEQLSSAEGRTVALVEQLFAEQITADDIEFKRDRLNKSALQVSGEPAERHVIAEVGAANIVPNYFLDKERTEQLKKDAVGGVQPVVIHKQKGEEVVGEGKIVTESQIALLRELGFIGSRIDATRVTGFALMSFAIIAAFAIYLHSFQRRIFENGRLLLVLAIIVVGTTLVGKIAISFSLPYLVPVAAAAMLSAILFNAEMAVIVTMVTALYAILIYGQDYRFAIIWLLGGLFSICTVWQIKHRTDLARAGLQLSLVLGGLVVATTFLSASITMEALLKGIGWGLASGMSASILTIGVLPFLEKVFGITTDIRLVELSYANQPLLRELMMTAPGTYNHSVMSGNLAESAAEPVGANPLLARVGAYYHDIGKIKRPIFFVENQVGGENPHDSTNPNLSCLIITSHVKEGVELVEREGLPCEIIDIVKEHHGTSVVSFFYQRAKENLMKEEVCESDFRYTGSKPRSREAALVMLADSVEAAARTVVKPTPQRLEQLTKRVIQQKLDDGQLAESDLTLGDLEKIARSFTQVLVSIYHTRIEYPVPAIPIRSANGNFAK